MRAACRSLNLLLTSNKTRFRACTNVSFHGERAFRKRLYIIFSRPECRTEKPDTIWQRANIEIRKIFHARLNIDRRCRSERVKEKKKERKEKMFHVDTNMHRQCVTITFSKNLLNFLKVDNFSLILRWYPGSITKSIRWSYKDFLRWSTKSKLNS